VRLQFAAIGVGGTAATLAGAKDMGTLPAWTAGIALAMPFVTWAFVLWARHSDLLIGLLSRYCEACEVFGDEANTTGLPGFHRRDQGWISLGRRAGELSDIADALLVLLTASPSAAVIILADTSLGTHSWVSPTAAVAFGAQILALAFVATKRQQRNQIAALSFRSGDDGWQAYRDGKPLGRHA
jgi:hypothetical protein